MNKRRILGIYFALALIRGRALFLLTMEFLSMGGVWVLFIVLLSVIFRKGIKNASVLLFSYSILMLALWFSNAFYAPYIQNTDYADNELVSLCETLINETNALYTSFGFDKEEIMGLAPKVMEIQNAEIKYAKHPQIMDQLRLSGIFIPLTGEAIVNADEHEFLLPFISCHELSHRNGILDEGQANMHAYVKCMESKIPSFQYSASVYALKYAMNELKLKNEAEYCRLEKCITECVQRDLNRMSVTKSNYRLFDYSSLIPCLIFDQSMTSQGVI